MRLNTEPRLADPDDLYAALMDAHRGLSREDSEKLDAKLVLLLANHIGELQPILDAIALAKPPPRA